jgi:2-polyprenyl-6-methoxyphenol hydroxylase-like FAD-dependent oxidoreductase
VTVGKEHHKVETRSSQTDVVVVGGGMAGLTAACYLAREQIDVTVIEAGMPSTLAVRPRGY